MANQVELTDDEAFWTTQLTEHCLFLHLLFQEEPWRSQAASLHELFRSQGGDIMKKTSELVAFKELALANLKAGRWLGWCLPSFLQHILFEAKYFQARMGAGTIATGDFQAWTKIVMEHALIGPKLIDPNKQLESSAADVATNLGALQQRCGVPNHQCLSEADHYFQSTNAWVRALPVGAHIVPPTLAAHIIRENDRGSLMMKRIGQ